MAITPRSFFRNPLLLWAAVLSIAGMSYLFCGSNTTCSKRSVKKTTISKVHHAPAAKHVKIKKTKKKVAKKSCYNKRNADPATAQARMTEMQSRVASPTRGWLGVEIQTLNAHRAKYAGVNVDQGVLVLNMQNSKPAQNAGFNAYDVVTHFNGVKVNTARQLINNVAKTGPGKRVPVKVIRGENELTLFPTLTSSDDL